MNLTNTQLKKIAMLALRAEYGFCPSTLSEIILLEACHSGQYIMFEVHGNEYQFHSYRLADGSIWVGKGTISRR